jgi:hypothetical protein
MQRALRHAGTLKQIRKPGRRSSRCDKLKKLNAPRKRLHARNRPGNADLGLIIDFQLDLHASHQSSVERMSWFPN